MEIKLDEVAMLLGEKDLTIFQLNKQLKIEKERYENLLKQKDEIYNELHALKLKTGSFPKEVKAEFKEAIKG